MQRPSRPGHTPSILKRPHRRFVEAPVQVGQHRGHAVERRVHEHGLQLNLERTVPGQPRAPHQPCPRTYLSALRWKVWPGALPKSTVSVSEIPGPSQQVFLPHLPGHVVHGMQ